MKYLVEDCDNPATPVHDYTEAKKVIRKVLSSYPSVRRAAIFGSFVRGEQKDSSDVDLLLQIDGNEDGEVMDIGFELVEGLGRDVDMLTTLNGAQSSFIESLKREGVRIFERPRSF
ncbi:nucleotidyltransferase family protein [Collinsella sp. AF28-5AC]|uniref:nucleotidyltransferase family protein n=1 Tax=Collinsella sp. AF28-5AC TaxID=2292227 RepID=UPI000E554503|nr:nucleotidyltransferase domain-containing protein [Collinsella sp. AF28-5AC]RGQ32861.1 hypothetical protein DWZ01_07385 [Collinsella sp. AF28-5AC]